VGKAVFAAVLVAHAVENVPPSVHRVRVGPVATWRPLLRQAFMPLVGDGRQHPAQEVGHQHFGGAGLYFGEGPLTGAVHGEEEVPAPFFGVDFGQIDGQIADGIALDLLFLFR
jgi:hypothetical protein